MKDAGNKPANGREDTHPRPATANIDVAVIGIPGELVSPAVQLLVQFVQQDVGQQRT